MSLSSEEKILKAKLRKEFFSELFNIECRRFDNGTILVPLNQGRHAKINLCDRLGQKFFVQIISKTLGQIDREYFEFGDYLYAEGESHTRITFVRSKNGLEDCHYGWWPAHPEDEGVSNLVRDIEAYIDSYRLIQ